MANIRQESGKSKKYSKLFHKPQKSEKKPEKSRINPSDPSLVLRIPCPSPGSDPSATIKPLSIPFPQWNHWKTCVHVLSLSHPTPGPGFALDYHSPDRALLDSGLSGILIRGATHCRSLNSSSFAFRAFFPFPAGSWTLPESD